MIRWVVISAIGGIGLLALLGGLLTPVAGRWRDGRRSIILTQSGPWVRGRCDLDGGGEHYTGLALFGWIRLYRYEYGRNHLLAAGFTDETIPLLTGQAMARFVFRRHGDELRGVFEGRVFTFAYEPPRILRVARLEPAPRAWQRV